MRRPTPALLIVLLNACLPDGADDARVASDAADTTTPETADAAPADTARGDLGADAIAIVVREGDEVIPQTTLHLDVDGLDGLGVCGFEWSVRQPAGSVSLFTPSPTVRSPTFECNIVGEYAFEVALRDCTGGLVARRAVPVSVTTDEAVHVELLWHTPGDRDESDFGTTADGHRAAGSDLDVHLLHPLAAGVFFDHRHDCFWNDPQPEWGALGVAHDPSLDRDDTDGAGPENINLGVLEDGAVYTIGVHYWNDWDYGSALATLRVYLWGELADEWSAVELVEDDLWESHTLDSRGHLARIGIAPRITPQYRRDVLGPSHEFAVPPSP